MTGREEASMPDTETISTALLCLSLWTGAALWPVADGITDEPDPLSLAK
jgi:hypothetical protein